MEQVARQPVVQAPPAVKQPFLAADVGGTHARIGLVRAGDTERVSVLAYRKYVCSEFSGLDAIVRDFMARYPDIRVTHGALACAGYPIDGVVVNDNLPWKVAIPELQETLGLEDLSLINDFEAVAYATQYIDPASTITLTRAHEAVQRGPQVIVGPGTGLGSAVLIPAQPQAIVLATEAGQIALAPGTALETEILNVLTRSYGHVSYEHVLSGPGLINLYRALCTLNEARPAIEDPAGVTTAALKGRDPLAKQALDVFCGLLGSFIGDLAMLYGAGGGIWLAGGILPHIRDFLRHSSFIERFLDKGRMRAFLERVPVRLMEHGQLGVIGAAGWFLDHQAGR